MMNMMIVDDEKTTREGIEQCIDWKSMGISVVASACNGQEAVEYYNKFLPQIIVTDVKMPKMDGLELAKRLRESNNNIHIIFISGYSDLSYLKSAFKYEVIDYLLKPINIEELRSVVQKIVKNNQIAEKDREAHAKLERQLEKSMPFLKEKFFRNLLMREIIDHDEIEDKLKFLDIYMDIDAEYAVLIISVDDAGIFNLKDQYDRQLLNLTILNMSNEIINNNARGYCFEWIPSEFVCVIELPYTESQIEKCIDTACQLLHDHIHEMGIKNTIGVGRWVKGLANLSQSFRFAQNALSRRIILGRDRIIYVDNNVEDAEELFVLPNQFYEQLTSSILNGDAENSITLLQQEYIKLSSANNRKETYFRNACLIIATCIVTAAGRVRIEDNDLKKCLANLHQEIIRCATLESIFEIFTSDVSRLCCYISDSVNSNNTELTKAIIKIIHSQFSENLTISNIAGQVFLSPNYICLLFKQETGKTINGYLTEVRIEKAKELLKNDNRKVQDVALSVGYHDQKYFCRLFKKYVGVNPSEYR